jgi:hypothetical protein
MLASSAHHEKRRLGRGSRLTSHQPRCAPLVDAALEQVAALRQTRHIEPAALKDPGLRHRDREEPTCTFGDDAIARSVQSGDEPSTKLLHLSRRQLINSHVIVPLKYAFGSRFYCWAPLIFKTSPVRVTT